MLSSTSTMLAEWRLNQTTRTLLAQLEPLELASPSPPLAALSLTGTMPSTHAHPSIAAGRASLAWLQFCLPSNHCPSLLMHPPGHHTLVVSSQHLPALTRTTSRTMLCRLLDTRRLTGLCETAGARLGEMQGTSTWLMALIHAGWLTL